MRDPELLEQYERDLELLTRVSNALPGALREAAELGSPLKGASYDGVMVAGGRTVMWCWSHETEVSRCHHIGRECSGESLTVSDPTGEAAVAPGRVVIARQQIEADLHSVHGVVERLVFNTAYLTRTPETHREARRREEERRDLAGENDARCRSCERTEVAPGVTRGEPVHVRSDVNVLDEPWPLCQWCYRFTRDFGVLPSREEVEGHHRGEKTRRKAS